MGGSSKPADPKVTPFVDPAGPKNPIPNWFAGGNTGGGMYKPDMGASASAFGQQPQQQAQQAMPQQSMQTDTPQAMPYAMPQNIPQPASAQDAAPLDPMPFTRGFAIPTPSPMAFSDPHNYGLPGLDMINQVQSFQNQMHNPISDISRAFFTDKLNNPMVSDQVRQGFMSNFGAPRIRNPRGQ